MSYPTRAEWLVNSTIPGQSGLRSAGNKGVLRISLSSSITQASQSDCHVLESRWLNHTPLGRAVGAFYDSSRLSHRIHFRGILPLCRDAIGVFYDSSCQGKKMCEVTGITSMIQRMVRSCEAVNRFLKKPFWFSYEVSRLQLLWFFFNTAISSPHVNTSCLMSTL